MKRRATLPQDIVAFKENSFFVILLRLIEQRMLCALDHSAEKRTAYVKHFLPLAETFYKHHCREEDITMAEELVKH